MKISKISAIVAAAAVAVSMAAVSASATNWANTSYADSDPNTVKIIATDENKVSFTSTADGIACKARVTVLREAGDGAAAHISAAKTPQPTGSVPMFMTMPAWAAGAIQPIPLRTALSSCSLQRFLQLIPSWYLWIGPAMKLCRL